MLALVTCLNTNCRPDLSIRPCQCVMLSMSLSKIVYRLIWPCQCVVPFNNSLQMRLSLNTNLFSWIESLLFEAETLDLVKVQASLKGDHIVCGDSSDGLVSRISGRVECQRSFTWHQLDLPLVWLELPTHRCTCVRIESAAKIAT